MNKRNHPYYNQITPTSPNQSVAVHKQNDVPFAPAPFEPFYNPRIANPAQPRWMANENKTFFFAEMFARDAYHRGLGYNIDGYGYIYHPETGNEACGGIISAEVVGSYSDESKNDKIQIAPTHIVNTEDYGLRYAQYTERGEVLDLGPVEHACILGNIDRPEGVFVPTCNTKAMADGMHLLNEMFKIATKDDQDLPIVHDIEDFKNGDIPREMRDCFDRMALETAALNKTAALDADSDHHECACGGNCQCGGNCKCGGKCKCGGTCKCKNNK